MNVDLPAPLGPSRPVMPGGTDTVTSLRPMTWPYHFDTWSADDDRPGHDRPAATLASCHDLDAADAALRIEIEADNQATITSGETGHGCRSAAAGGRSRRRAARGWRSATATRTRLLPVIAAQGAEKRRA